MADQDAPAGVEPKADRCATPSTTPPAKVPQNEPRPPMITASNANSSSAGRRSVRRSCECLEHAGDGDQDEGDGRGKRVDPAVVDAHQLRGLAVVGVGAERAPERVRAEQPLQRSRVARPPNAKIDERQPADREPLAQRDARGLDAGLDRARIGGEDLEQRVLDDDRESERDQQRRQEVAPERAVEHPASAAT